MTRQLTAAITLTGALLGVGCDTATEVTELDDALGRFRQAFETADVRPLEALFPAGWALTALAGETRRSSTGAALKRQLERLFRNRAPIGWREEPRSVRRSEDGAYVLFVGEWTSMALGTDELLVESCRIGLERVTAAGRGPAAWKIREFTAWTR